MAAGGPMVNLLTAKPSDTVALPLTAELSRGFPSSGALSRWWPCRDNFSRRRRIRPNTVIKRHPEEADW